MRPAWISGGLGARAVLLALCALSILILLQAGGAGSATFDACTTNPVACENALPGAPQSEWDVTGSGDPSIQGYATPFSSDAGATVRFKVATPATAYRIDIYRLGYYGGLGARKVTTVFPSAALPQAQPNCISEATTGLVDCGNWGESASWDVPADAVSGVYLAKLVRTDAPGESHIVFVVRDDDGGSDLLFQTSDTTWQAYNRYGGNSLYVGSPDGRAYKVSYNRPFTTRGHTNVSFLFSGEYPMIRWLERNGYDVSYSSGIDTARRGNEILEHQAFLSVGHDEYWSAGQRANVEAARDAGVDLAFFSGNEIFWKTRWEPSIDGTSTPYTTLVSYKETKAGAKIDPDPAWTGTWRDARFSPPADGGRPENALTGTIFTVNSYREDAITVPASFGALRLWRNTSVATLAPGATATFPVGTLGHEWDEDLDNGWRPAGLMRLSATTLTVPTKILDEGNTFGSGTATHSLTLYKAASGALVFGAGTVQWGWGLDSTHDVFSANPPRPADVRMQQATMNLFGDMNVQPATRQPELVAAAPSTDASAPTSTITAPANGAVVRNGYSVTISGTATDAGGGVVAGVEVTTDGGESWHRAGGTQSWSYSWIAGGDKAATIQSRAVDDSGNIESPGPGVIVDVTCPCRLWSSIAVPGTQATSDTAAVELGTKFSVDTAGWISGVRFYKGPGNTGTHVGSLWASGGTLLARATFTGESAGGWQEVQFDAPVAVTPGTVYIASYHAPAGRYSLNLFYFSSLGYDNSPLHAPASGAVGGNGVYTYGSAPTFPSSSYGGSNYWVDAVFYDTAPVDTRRPTVVATNPARDATNVDAYGSVEATFSEAVAPASLTPATFFLSTAGGQSVPASVEWNPVARKAVLTPSASLAFAAPYVATVKGGSTGVKDPAGNALAKDYTWPFQTAAMRTCPCSIWSPSATPAVAATGDHAAVELGLKFRADLAGWVTGVRFYKGTGNTGTHVGSLWSADGTLLARATFSNESAGGWQEASFDQAVAVAAGATYIVSYHAPNGGYALTSGGFGAAGVSNPPLRALKSGVDGSNGVFRYGASPGFPTDSFADSNYWVDLVFTDVQPADTTPPQVASTSPADGTTGVATAATVAVTFSEPVDPATIDGQTFQLHDAGGAVVPATITYAAATRTATLQPDAELSFGGAYTATVRGGSTGVKDGAGNALAADKTWGFAVKSCPCTIFSAAQQPAVTSATDGNAVELGVKLRADRAGWISGIRFFKGPGNTGTHVGSLWRTDGTLLARATFTGETAGGWQDVSFEAPVAIQAGTTYIASYHAPNGHYALTPGGFAGTGAGSSPVQALANGTDGPNGVYRYGAAPAYPTDTWGAGNYWVDVAFSTTRPVDTQPPTVLSSAPAPGATGVPPGSAVLVTFSEDLDPASITPGSFQLLDANGSEVTASRAYDPLTRTASLVPATDLAWGATYTARVRGGAAGVTDEAGNPLAVDWNATFTTKACPCSLWATPVPGISSSSDHSSVELGVKFTADLAGMVTGLRFYQGAGNVGPHIGSLWSADGTLLARVAFPASSGPGWQQAQFGEAVPIEAGVTYVASYFAPNGGYAVDLGYFTPLGFANPPLRTPVAAGVFRYSGSPAYPTETWASSNYWVDVMFALP